MEHQQSNPSEQGEVGYKKPPKANQFGQPNANPRNNGSWVKTDTPRYKLERMMEMGESELRAIAEDKDRPLFERKIARFIKDGNWKEIKEMIAEVYGVPKQVIEQTNLEPPKPLKDLSKKDK